MTMDIPIAIKTHNIYYNKEKGVCQDQKVIIIKIITFFVKLTVFALRTLTFLLNMAKTTSENEYLCIVINIF